jgi:hypothetical protein
MMIVRASRDMEAGNEITFWYHSRDGAMTKEIDAANAMMQHYGHLSKLGESFLVRAAGQAQEKNRVVDG